MFSFAWPFLFILLPLPLLAWKFLPRAMALQTQALQVPDVELFIQQQVKQSSTTVSKAKIPVFFAFLIWILLLTSSANPQWIGETIELPISGRDLLLAVDLSGSMQEEDMLIDDKYYNRLIAVKVVVSEFIQKRKGDRLGLILFADHAYLQTPLTYDSQTVQNMLIEAELGLVGKQTAIGEAIGLAIKRVKDLPAEQTQSRVLILLTDGANTAGISPLKVAKLAKQIGLKIYTIGIGADEMVVRTIFGRQKVNPSRDLDEKTLNEIAMITGGEYFRARDTENLKKIYQTINQIELIETEKKTYRPIKSLFFWPLGCAFILSLLLVIVYQVNIYKTSAHKNPLQSKTGSSYV
ncbi:MAG: VWA domain-containing protein [Pseudomonadota bacterium]